MTAAPQVATPASGLFTFDEAAHAYHLDGVRLPSVTQVLEDVEIIDYGYIPPSTRQMALERGSAVHQAIHYDIEGDLDWASLDPALIGYVEAARAVRRDYHLAAPELVEHRGYHPKFRYAGTLDLKQGDILLDWKTNDAPWWVAVQTAAYAALFPDPASLRRFSFELHADGRYKAAEFRCTDFSRDFQVFLSALNVFTAKSQHGSNRS